MTTTAPTRPVLRYHGGKWRIAPWIIGHFPSHRIYVEPFGGGASVLMRKPRADFEVYNDIDGAVVNVFRVLRDRTDARELERLLRLTPWAHAEFRESYEPTNDPVEWARRTVVRCFMAHGSSSRRKARTGFRAGSHPHRRGGGFGDWRSYHDALSTFTDRLQGIVIEDRDALEIIDRYDAPDALIYVDPPYLAETRTSLRGPGDGNRCYAVEMTDDDHRRLAGRLANCAAAVVVSGYPSPLYTELYADWQHDTREARADGGVLRHESIWVKGAGTRMAAPRSLVQGSLSLGIVG